MVCSATLPRQWAWTPRTRPGEPACSDRRHRPRGPRAAPPVGGPSRRVRRRGAGVHRDRRGHDGGPKSLLWLLIAEDGHRWSWPAVQRATIRLPAGTAPPRHWPCSHSRWCATCAPWARSSPLAWSPPPVVGLDPHANEPLAFTSASVLAQTPTARWPLPRPRAPGHRPGHVRPALIGGCPALCPSTQGWDGCPEPAGAISLARPGTPEPADVAILCPQSGPTSD
jgi:hypothetical protein